MSHAARRLPAREAARPSRRDVGRGAAWSVPLIAIGAAAPAMAASGPPTLPAFSAADGWTLSENGAPTEGGAEFLDSRFSVHGSRHHDTYLASAAHPLDVVLGRSYSFTYDWTADTSFPNETWADLVIDGEKVDGSRIYSSRDISHGTMSVTYTAPATRTAILEIRVFTTDYSGNSADQLVIYPIRVDHV